MKIREHLALAACQKSERVPKHVAVEVRNHGAAVVVVKVSVLAVGDTGAVLGVYRLVDIVLHKVLGT